MPRRSLSPHLPIDPQFSFAASSENPPPPFPPRTSTPGSRASFRGLLLVRLTTWWPFYLNLQRLTGASTYSFEHIFNLTNSGLIASFREAGPVSRGETTPRWESPENKRLSSVQPHNLPYISSFAFTPAAGLPTTATMPKWRPKSELWFCHPWFSTQLTCASPS